ncbi:unnamed protein product [Pleuronectes platessa]|uniref:Uncharacterized protein n=1 Tax=Pleuronectes platessa TaxID=8262 RepID=A0A9N7V667_PLEPL|nr:unnamed protein product [Pleuronectes platessa]
MVTDLLSNEVTSCDSLTVPPVSKTFDPSRGRSGQPFPLVVNCCRDVNGILHLLATLCGSAIDPRIHRFNFDFLLFLFEDFEQQIQSSQGATVRLWRGKRERQQEAGRRRRRHGENIPDLGRLVVAFLLFRDSLPSLFLSEQSMLAPEDENL